MPFPTGSGRRCCRGSKQEFGDAWFVGEVIHGDYSAHVRDAGFDSVTQYELWKAIWSSLNDGNFHELDQALQRHNDFLDVFVPMTFIGNHDVTRIASKLENTRHLEHALVILLTVGRHPERVRGRRVRLSRSQRGTRRWRRRRTARIHHSPDGCRRTRPRHLPAASVSDRVAPTASVAAHRQNIGGQADQHAVRLPDAVRFGHPVGCPQHRRCSDDVVAE